MEDQQSTGKGEEFLGESPLEFQNLGMDAKKAASHVPNEKLVGCEAQPLNKPAVKCTQCISHICGQKRKGGQNGCSAK